MPRHWDNIYIHIENTVATFRDLSSLPAFIYCVSSCPQVYYGLCVTFFVTASWVGATHAIKYLYMYHPTKYPVLTGSGFNFSSIHQQTVKRYSRITLLMNNDDAIIVKTLRGERYFPSNYIYIYIRFS